MNNRKLYESIMKNVAKEVKKALNENELPDNYKLTDKDREYLTSVLGKNDKDNYLKIQLYYFAEDHNFDYKVIYKEINDFLANPDIVSFDQVPEKIREKHKKRLITIWTEVMTKYLQTEDTYNKVISEIREIISKKYKKDQLAKEEKEAERLANEQKKQNKTKAAEALLKPLIDAGVRLKFQGTYWKIEIEDDGNIRLVDNGAFDDFDQ